MRRVYQDTYAKDGSAYTDEDFEAATISIGGRTGIEEIFETRVEGRKDVDFDRFLDYVGLKLDPKGPQDARGFIGVRLGSDGGRTTVKVRLAGSPAESMGLSVGDEIVGIDGYRMGGDKLQFYISNAKPGNRVALVVARNGILTELAGELGKKPFFEYRIVPKEEVSDQQKSLFAGWLLEEWQPELKYPEYARSPDRKTNLDFV